MNMDMKMGLSISIPLHCLWTEEEVLGNAGCKADYALLCKKTHVSREHMTAERLKGA